MSFAIERRPVYPPPVGPIAPAQPVSRPSPQAAESAGTEAPTTYDPHDRVPQLDAEQEC